MSRYDDYYNKLIFRIKYPLLARLGAAAFTTYSGFYIKALGLKQKYRSNKSSSCINNVNKKNSLTSPILDNQQFAKEISDPPPCIYDVSIIVPCYNVEAYIRDCITSILNQVTSFSYELILIDDGSTDHTREILMEYQNHEHVTVRSQENHGIGNARNRGMELAKGFYYLFVDSDDMLAPGILQVILSYAYRKKADIVDANYEILLGDRRYPTRYLSQREYLVNLKKHPEFILKVEGFPWMKLYSRALFDGVKWPENFDFEDTIVRMTLLRRAVIYCHVNKVGYYYRKHSQSTVQTLNRIRKELDAFFVVEYLLQVNEQIGLEHDETLYRILLLQLSKYLYPRINGCTKEKQCEVLNSCKQLLEQIQECKPSKLSRDYKVIDQIIRNLDWKAWRSFSMKI